MLYLFILKEEGEDAMMQYTINRRAVSLFPANTKAPCVWLNNFSQEAEEVWNTCRELKTPPFTLAAIQIDDWNGALSPWPAKAVFKGKQDFAGQADAYIQELTGNIIPEITELLPEKPQYHAIAGYSMAGLFAVYALYRTQVFFRAASASGSLWYPGFLEYTQSHELAANPEAVYLSLGDRERRTKNPIMATVEERTEVLYQLFSNQQIPAIFELNPGNHFQDHALRMAKGIQWILKQGNRNDPPMSEG